MEFFGGRTSQATRSTEMDAERNLRLYDSAYCLHAGAGEIDCERLKIAALAAVQKQPP
jgi:hypothetical protein